MASAVKQHKPGVWTEDEDALLATWQHRVGNKWSEVARHIPGKTGQQCAQRWRHRVNPNISREKWSHQEDAKLAALVDKYGNSWAEIARRLPGRTDQQCMGRWRRHLDPSIRREGWEALEDEQLRELYGEFGSSWSCISKSMSGRTAQQCRARWCQLSNAERSSRSGASLSRSASLGQGQEGGPSVRRLSTANTYGAGPQGGAASDPVALFAAASAAAGDAWGAQRRGGLRAARRLSTVSEAAALREEDSWSDDDDEEEEEDEEGEDSPDVPLRRATARTASRGGRAPAAAAAEQQVPTPAPASGAPAPPPAVALPGVLPPLRLELPAAGGSPASEEESPALTQAAGPHMAAAAAAAADLLSPLRRKRSAVSRLASFGPTLPPLVIPDGSAAAARHGTPLRVTPGSGPMSLELRSPNVLTLLQSPAPLSDDLFRSPGFGSMVTPSWAKTGSSGARSAAAAAAAATQEPDGDDDRRQSVARRLDSAPTFGGLGAGEAAAVAAAAGGRQQGGAAGPLTVPVAAACGGLASLDFAALLGSPAKKSKMSSPPLSSLAAASAAALLLQQPCESGGGTSLAMAVQQHLLLASTAKAAPGSGGSCAGAPEAAAARQLTLTAGKPPLAPPADSPVKQLTSSSVRMRLHALLDTA